MCVQTALSQFCFVCPLYTLRSMFRLPMPTKPTGGDTLWRHAVLHPASTEFSYLVLTDPSFGAFFFFVSEGSALWGEGFRRNKLSCVPKGMFETFGRFPWDGALIREAASMLASVILETTFDILSGGWGAYTLTFSTQSQVTIFALFRRNIKQENT